MNNSINVKVRYRVVKGGLGKVTVTSPITDKIYHSKEMSANKWKVPIIEEGDLANYEVWSMICYHLHGGSHNPANPVTRYDKPGEYIKDTQLQNAYTVPDMMVNKHTDDREYYLTVSNPCGTGKSTGLINTVIQEFRQYNNQFTCITPRLILVADSTECNRYADEINKGCGCKSIAKAYHAQENGDLLCTSSKGKTLVKKLSDVKQEISMIPIVVITHARLTSTTVWMDQIASNVNFGLHDRRLIICDEKPSQSYLKYHVELPILKHVICNLTNELREEYELSRTKTDNHIKATKKLTNKERKKIRKPFSEPAYLRELHNIVNKTIMNKTAPPAHRVTSKYVDEFIYALTSRWTMKSPLNILLSNLARGSSGAYNGMVVPKYEGISNSVTTADLRGSNRELLLSHLRVALSAIYLGRYDSEQLYKSGYSIYVDTSTALSLSSYNDTCVLLDGTAGNSPEKLSADTRIINTSGKDYSDPSCNVKLVRIEGYTGSKSSLKRSTESLPSTCDAIRDKIVKHHSDESVLISFPKDHSGGDELEYTTELKKSLEYNPKIETTSWLSDKGSNKYANCTAYVAGTVFSLPNSEYAKIALSKGISTRSSKLINKLKVYHQAEVIMQSISRTAIRKWDSTEVVVYIPNNEPLLKVLSEAYNTPIHSLKGGFASILTSRLAQTTAIDLDTRRELIHETVLTTLASSYVERGIPSVRSKDLASNLGYQSANSLIRYIGKDSEQLESVGLVYKQHSGRQPSSYKLMLKPSVIHKLWRTQIDNVANICTDLGELLQEVYTKLTGKLPTMDLRRRQYTY